MKIQKTKLGFTLIELMVVITIIGILATGAVSVYTSQIQKARDSNRVTSAKALQSSVEQWYSDLSEYPGISDASAPTLAECTWMTKYNLQCLVELWYMEELPKDKKTWSKGNGSPLDFWYNVASLNWVASQVYEVSTWFEAAWSVASKASNLVDKWGDNNRMETWNKLTLSTAFKWTTWQATDTDSDDTAITVASCHQVSNVAWAPIVVKWNCAW